MPGSTFHDGYHPAEGRLPYKWSSPETSPSSQFIRQPDLLSLLERIMHTAQKSNAVTTLRAHLTTTPPDVFRALARTISGVGNMAAQTLSSFKRQILASPGRDYEPLCDDLGHDKRACLGARVLIILATTFAPAGSLTSKDAIAVASLWIGLSRHVFDALRQTVPLRAGAIDIKRKWQTIVPQGQTSHMCQAAAPSVDGRTSSCLDARHD